MGMITGIANATAYQPKETNLLSLEHTFQGENRVSLRIEKNAVSSAWHRQCLLVLVSFV